MKRFTHLLWLWFWKTFLNDKRGYWIGMTRLFLIRFFRRLRFTFRLCEIWRWGYENCRSCGINYRLPVNVKDGTWIKVNGIEEGCLCINCFLQIAHDKGIGIEKKHFDNMWIFDPERNLKGIDIIGEIGGEGEK